jgi:hypothetical protein
LRHLSTLMPVMHVTGRVAIIRGKDKKRSYLEAL